MKNGYEYQGTRSLKATRKRKFFIRLSTVLQTKKLSVLLVEDRKLGRALRQKILFERVHFALCVAKAMNAQPRKIIAVNVSKLTSTLFNKCKVPFF